MFLSLLKEKYEDELAKNKLHFLILTNFRIPDFYLMPNDSWSPLTQPL